LKLTFETGVFKLSLCILDTIALKYVIGLHKLVAVIFAVSFEITPIIQGAVGNESCYPKKNTLIITLLYNKSKKNTLQ
jgi:hypothetical protein